VHPGDRPYEKRSGVSTRPCCPGTAADRRGARARRAGVRAAQPQRGSPSRLHAAACVGALGVPDRLFREVPVALTVAQVAELTTVTPRSPPVVWPAGSTCRAAVLAVVDRAAVLDPATNRRTDGYGGSPAARRRFLLELVASVRAAIGRTACSASGSAATTARERDVCPARRGGRGRAGGGGHGQLDYVNTRSAWPVRRSTGSRRRWACRPATRWPCPGRSARPLRADLGPAAPPVLGVGRFTTAEQVRRRWAAEPVTWSVWCAGRSRTGVRRAGRAREPCGPARLQPGVRRRWAAPLARLRP